MKQIASFTPEQAKAIWTTHKRLVSSRLLETFDKRLVADDPGVHQVYVYNDSGEFIPRFACMQVAGTMALGGATFIKVVKPDKTDGVYLFNTERPIGEKGTGVAYAWGIVRMLGDVDTPTIEPGNAFKPVAGQWYIEQGDGPFEVFGPDRIDKKVLRGRFAGSGGSGKASLIRFEIQEDPYAYGEGSSVCAEKVITDATSWKAKVVGMPCGSSTVDGMDDNGLIELTDPLGWLIDFEEADIVGRSGFATRVMDENGYLCQWEIVSINMFRPVINVTEVVDTGTNIDVYYEKQYVWNNCELPKETIVTTDCDATEY